MSPDQIRNLSASVLARLLSRAKETGDDYQNLITAFLCERFLYRLGSSVVRDRFALIRSDASASVVGSALSSHARP